MSQIPNYTAEVTASKRPNGSKLWITASFLLSGTILAWAFSAPFRASNSTQVLSSANGSASPDLIESVNHRRIYSSEVKAMALEMDRKFMKELAHRREQAFPKVPGRKEVNEQWVRRVDRARRELKSLQSARTGSLEADYRDCLAEKLKDAPLE